MKNSIFIVVTFASISLISCKTQESAYRKAWEKAQAQQQGQQIAQDVQNNQTVPVVTVETPVNPVEEYDNTVNTNTNNNNYNNYNNNNNIVPNNNSVTYNNNVDEYSLSNVKRYCVIIGSFESVAGAEQRRQQVINDGYGSARIIRGGLGYRVVATSFNDIQSARSSRNTLIKNYDGTWILDTQK